MIQPTVGKRLWFWPTRASTLDAPYDLFNQPLAAFVTYVNRDGTVNIAYLDRNGSPDRRITVPLWQRGQPRPMGNFCEFHPDDMGTGAQAGAKISSVTPVIKQSDLPKPTEMASRATLSIKKPSEPK